MEALKDEGINFNFQIRLCLRVEMQRDKSRFTYSFLRQERKTLLQASSYTFSPKRWERELKFKSCTNEKYN